MLNSTQLQTLAADILTHPELDVARLAGDDIALAAYYNAEASPDYYVWKSITPTSDILGNITWANFTPANPIAGAGQDFLNWATQCMLKRDNLWCLLASQSGSMASGIATGKTKIRDGLQDALTGVPSGTNGTSKSVGWPDVKLAMQRKATVLEKMFSTGAGTTADPSTLGVEGLISYAEISGAR